MKFSTEKVYKSNLIFFLKYLCRECGYRYSLAIPIILVKETRFAETPVAMIKKEDQKCPHIWGYWPEKDFFLLKFRVMSEIRVLQEKFPSNSSENLTQSAKNGDKN